MMAGFFLKRQNSRSIQHGLQGGSSYFSDGDILEEKPICRVVFSTWDSL